MNPILVTCYVNPDLDGFAGVFAYAEFLNKKGINAQAGIIGEPHDEIKYVLDRFNLPGLKTIANADNFTDVILVDASDLIGLEGKVAPEKVIEIIDHRQINEAEKFPRAKTQVELVGAAATLVAEKFKQENMQISKESAILIYSAIISNTLNFKSSVTTERDKNIAAWLGQFIQAPVDYWQELFRAKSNLTGEKLAERIAGDFAWFILGDKKFGIAQLEIIGAAELIRQRGDEIISILNRLKTDLSLDYVFQNTIELEKLKNYLVTDDDATKTILEKVLPVKFVGMVAVSEQLIMRKQIVPLIKVELDNCKY
jgi:manganese-dependent inorganic pyrophosphatase